MENAKVSLFGMLTRESRIRELTGFTAKIATYFAIAISLYHIYIYAAAPLLLDPIQHRIIHVTTLVVLAWFVRSFSQKRSTKFPKIDILFIVLSVAAGIYFIANGERFVNRILLMDPVTSLDILFGSIFLLIILEATRRATGIWLPLIVVICLAYLGLSSYIPGIWFGRELTFAQIIDVMLLEGRSAIWGSQVVAISASYIILFVLFGQLFLHSGGGEFFTKFATTLLRNASGGPAKVAVIASALFGTMTSSGSANVATTGAFTIPMMKKVGFKSHEAGGIECAASVGGMFMPPIMAGIAFIMSSLTGIPYFDIILVAAIPGVLYYFCCFMQVHFISRKRGIRGSFPESEVSFRKTMIEGWSFFLPLIVIIVVLALGYSPIRAAIYGMGTTVLVGITRKENRTGIKVGLGKLSMALEGSARLMTMIVMAIVCSGIIMWSVYFTGLASKTTSIILSISGDSLFAVLIICAVACLLLGMALPGIIAYILTVLLIVPAAVEMGVPIIAAHLFGLYFATLAVITPPVGTTFFVAAALANAPPMLVGRESIKFAVGGFVVPFFFIYNPPLLLMGNPAEIALATLLAIIGIGCIAAGLAGWLIKEANIWQRILLGVGGSLLCLPDIWIRVTGLCMIAVAVLLQLRKAIAQRQNTMPLGHTGEEG